MEEKKRMMATKRSTVDQLEKLAERGERLWVDLNQVEMVRKQAEAATRWMADYLKSGLDQGTAQLEDLKELLKRGEQIQGVDYHDELELLRKATEVFCMCRGARDETMIRCGLCSEEFHRECLGKECFANACPMCVASRSAEMQMGEGMAAMGRLQVIDSLALINQLQISDDSEHRAGELVKWFRALLIELARTFPQPLPPKEIPAPSPLIVDCSDVKTIVNGIEAKYWHSQLSKFRHRPALEAFEAWLDRAPSCISRDALRGLLDIKTRAQVATQQFLEIWNCPPEYPNHLVLERCRVLRKALESIPVELNHLSRALDSCIDDGAGRYCLCNKFNDGKTMVQCERCQNWFHARCVDLKEDAAPTMEGEYFCPNCRPDDTVV